MFIDLYGIRSYFLVFGLGQPNRNGKNVLSDHFSSKRKKPSLRFCYCVWLRGKHLSFKVCSCKLFSGRVERKKHSVLDIR